ncbi:MAG: hypothetical protein ACRENE_08525, partial [Polyangiaceae bacterium]
PQREPWPADNVERWTAALVGYQASVKRDRVVPIGPESLPFAAYFNALHERIRCTTCVSLAGADGGMIAA